MSGGKLSYFYNEWFGDEVFSMLTFNFLNFCYKTSFNFNVQTWYNAAKKSVDILATSSSILHVEMWEKKIILIVTKKENYSQDDFYKTILLK